VLLDLLDGYQAAPAAPGSVGRILLVELAPAAQLELTAAPLALVELTMSHLLIRNTAQVSIAVLADGAAADPATLVARVVDPEGGEASYTYGTDAEIQRDTVGAYTLSVPVGELAGRWWFSVTTTDPDAYSEGALVVDPTRIPE
jgi:hypothetical protein